MPSYRVTRDGKPIGVCEWDSRVKADTPLLALASFVPCREIEHTSSKSAAVTVSGFRYEATEVEA